MVLRVFLLLMLFSFCSCRVYLPSLERFAIESNGSRIHSKVRYEGVLALGDRPGTSHHDVMYRILTAVKGIPEENVVSVPQFLMSGGEFDDDGNLRIRSSGLVSLRFLDKYAGLYSQIRVVCMPVLMTVFGNEYDQVSLIDKSGILFVVSAGNVSTIIKSRDLWNPDHSFWSEEQPGVDYNLYKELITTDNIIVATSLGFQWDENRENITFSPSINTVRCGELRENCFSVPGYREYWDDPSSDDFYAREGFSTSEASATLSAISFYLAQMYPTAEEIVATLRSCAIDVGEPGPDEQYGVGLVNIVCPEVLEKEMAVATQSIEVSGKSHVFDDLTQRTPSDTFSFLSSVQLGYHGMEGYAGISCATKSFQAVALAGFGHSSLGIFSDLYQQRDFFVELGIRKPLTPNLSFVGTYGHQYGHLSIDSVRAGIHVVRQIGRARLDIYGGRHFLWSSLGLPGYQLAGARKVSFSRGVWEARFSLSMSL